MDLSALRTRETRWGTVKKIGKRGMSRHRHASKSLWGSRAVDDDSVSKIIAGVSNAFDAVLVDCIRNRKLR